MLPVFWIKMSLVLLLLANGYIMLRTERALEQGDLADASGWRRLRSAAIGSLCSGSRWCLPGPCCRK